MNKQEKETKEQARSHLRQQREDILSPMAQRVQASTEQTAFDATLQELERAVMTYAEALSQHGKLPKSHSERLQQVTRLLDNWQSDYDDES